MRSGFCGSRFEATTYAEEVGEVSIFDIAKDSAVNNVTCAGGWWDVLEATIDSGAADTVGPQQTAEWVQIRETKASKPGPTYNAEEGGVIIGDDVRSSRGSGVTGGWDKVTHLRLESFPSSAPSCSMDIPVFPKILAFPPSAFLIVTRSDNAFSSPIFVTPIVAAGKHN